MKPKITEESPGTTRERLIEAAAGLLAVGGRDAVSTRAVSAVAGVQAPTLYRLFGDKEGLLDAVAAYGFDQYLADKVALGSTGDVVADLRRGWDLHVEFGLSRPEFYVLMYGDARPGRVSPAAEEAAKILRGMVERVAAAGRLRLSVDRAVRLVGAAGRGVVMELIALPPEDRDPEVPAIVRELVLQALITSDGPDAVQADGADGADGMDDAGAVLANRAVALHASLDRLPADVLTEAEQGLLKEWLGRIADRT